MNNFILPLATPQILTTAMFQNYGFFTGSATQFQIDAAFSIAENQCALAIGTFLAPTIVTGNVAFLGYGTLYQLPVGKLSEIYSVTLHEDYANGVSRLISGTSIIVDGDNGFYTISESLGDNSTCAGCGGSQGLLGSYDMVFKAGYPSGVALSSPSLQLALCMAADIVMKQMYDEGIAVIYENMIRTQQVGRVIQSFETKGFYGNTIFGPSSRGQYILNLLKPYQIIRAGRI